MPDDCLVIRKGSSHSTRRFLYLAILSRFFQTFVFGTIFFIFQWSRALWRGSLTPSLKRRTKNWKRKLRELLNIQATFRLIERFTGFVTYDNDSDGLMNGKCIRAWTNVYCWFVLFHRNWELKVPIYQKVFVLKTPYLFFHIVHTHWSPEDVAASLYLNVARHAIGVYGRTTRHRKSAHTSVEGEDGGGDIGTPVKMWAFQSESSGAKRAEMEDGINSPWLLWRPFWNWAERDDLRGNDRPPVVNIGTLCTAPGAVDFCHCPNTDRLRVKNTAGAVMAPRNCSETKWLGKLSLITW